jgi:hypothetical protein
MTSSIPKPRLRSLIALAASAILGASLAPVATGAQANLFRGSADYGTRAQINGTLGSVPSGTGTIASVRIQNTASTALFQFGHIRQNAVNASCSPTTFVGRFVEYKRPTGPYTCVAETSLPPGESHLFTVTRDPNVAEAWRFYYDGVYQSVVNNMGFNTGVSYVAAEYVGSGAPSGYSMNWGPGSTTPWQYRVGSGTAAFTTVTSATSVGSGYTLGGTSPPSRFTYSR